MMLQTTFGNCRPHSCFKDLLSISLCTLRFKNIGAPMNPQGHNFNNLGKGPLGDVYQIWRL